MDTRERVRKKRHRLPSSSTFFEFFFSHDKEPASDFLDDVTTFAFFFLARSLRARILFARATDAAASSINIFRFLFLVVVCAFEGSR